jgi:hypothetical protein
MSSPCRALRRKVMLPLRLHGFASTLQACCRHCPEVRACMHACVHARVSVCVRACVRACEFAEMAVGVRVLGAEDGADLKHAIHVPRQHHLLVAEDTNPTVDATVATVSYHLRGLRRAGMRSPTNRIVHLVVAERPPTACVVAHVRSRTASAVRKKAIIGRDKGAHAVHAERLAHSCGESAGNAMCAQAMCDRRRAACSVQHADWGERRTAAATARGTRPCRNSRA